MDMSQSSASRILHLTGWNSLQLRRFNRRHVMQVEEYGRSRRRKALAGLVKQIGPRNRHSAWLIGDQSRVDNRDGKLSGFDVTGLPVSVSECQS